MITLALSRAPLHILQSLRSLYVRLYRDRTDQIFSEKGKQYG